MIEIRGEIRGKAVVGRWNKGDPRGTSPLLRGICEGMIADRQRVGAPGLAVVEAGWETGYQAHCTFTNAMTQVYEVRGDMVKTPKMEPLPPGAMS